MYYRFYNTQKEKKEYASVIRKRTKHKRQNLQTGFQHSVRQRITGVVPANKIFIEKLICNSFYPFEIIRSSEKNT